MMKIKTNVFAKACKSILLLSVLSSVLIGSSAYAELGQIQGRITRTLADSQYGGCMIRLDANIQTVLPNCGKDWISLDCDAEYHTPEQSSAMWDSALLALALDKVVVVWAEDTQLVTQGFCTARRIDIIK